MSTIVPSSTCRATTDMRNSVSKVANNYVQSGHLTAAQLAASKAKTSTCTPDTPCHTPNCRKCSSRVYDIQTSDTANLITHEACNSIPVHAITIVSKKWTFEPPYDLQDYKDDIDQFVCILRANPNLKWTLHHDLAIHGNSIQPHIHGTITGKSAEYIREEIESCLEIIGVAEFDVDVCELTKPSPVQPIEQETVQAWSKYQNKMQHLNTNSCRTSDDTNTILSLRVLSSTLFCDSPTYFSNLKPSDSFPYILRNQIALAAPSIVLFGFPDLASRLDLDVSQTTRNSEMLQRLQRIRMTDDDVTSIRKAVHKCIVSGGTAFTKKLLLCLLASGAHQTKNEVVLEKLTGYWPVPSTSLSERHFWAQWLDLLLSN